MKCPNCGESLWFIKDVCPFCKTTITQTQQTKSTTTQNTDALSELDAKTSDGAEWVTFVKCETLPEADAIRARLEAANIPSILPDEALMQAIAWNVNTYGFIRIQIAAKDCEAAREVLSALKQDATAGVSEPGVKLEDLPLSWPMRCFAFTMPLLTCPGLLLFALARSGYSRQGCKRKTTDLWRWFIYGAVFWFVGFVTFLTLRGHQVR